MHQLSGRKIRYTHSANWWVHRQLAGDKILAIDLCQVTSRPRLGAEPEAGGVWSVAPSAIRNSIRMPAPSRFFPNMDADIPVIGCS